MRRRRNPFSRFGVIVLCQVVIAGSMFVAGWGLGRQHQRKVWSAQIATMIQNWNLAGLYLEGKWHVPMRWPYKFNSARLDSLLYPKEGR